MQEKQIAMQMGPWRISPQQTVALNSLYWDVLRYCRLGPAVVGTGRGVGKLWTILGAFEKESSAKKLEMWYGGGDAAATALEVMPDRIALPAAAAYTRKKVPL